MHRLSGDGESSDGTKRTTRPIRESLDVAKFGGGDEELIVGS